LKLKFLFFCSLQIQVHANSPNINANIFFGIDDKDNKLGLAYVATICSTELIKRIAIVEWKEADLVSGEVIYNIILPE
jgi:hypothetical protein